MTELFPSKAVQQSSSHTRYSALPTATKIKKSYLFGLPLKSSLTQQELSDETIDDQIRASISWLEHTLDLYISPITFEERHDWHKQHWSANFGMIKLTHSNVMKVNTIKFVLTNNSSYANAQPFSIPDDMIYVEPKDGMVRIVPTVAYSLTGWFYSTMSGFMWQMLQNKDRIPGVIWVSYEVGFEEDKVPALFCDIIGIHAALELLSLLSAILFPYSSHSISQDGLSQSTGSPGAQYLAGRIQQLQARLQDLLNTARSYYTKNLVFDWM